MLAYTHLKIPPLLERHEGTPSAGYSRSLPWSHSLTSHAWSSPLQPLFAASPLSLVSLQPGPFQRIHALKMDHTCSPGI
ncbi:hypothetical protein CISIN_1g034963mg [Citrus sinensis]|uniref:Uncharacterized protein n=1 Tax=Citrus sinensis TaxID=2711 RepID=A0A067G6W7_CITSI|nr:hypothetical protein CISIN_1g034963mg [Citrus sinensis]